MKVLDSNECLRDFGDFIRTQRERKGLTQAEVADRVGLHQTYYGKIELGRREVDLFKAIAICKALEMDLSDFVKTYTK